MQIHLICSKATQLAIAACVLALPLGAMAQAQNNAILQPKTATGKPAKRAKLMSREAKEKQATDASLIQQLNGVVILSSNQLLPQDQVKSVQGVELRGPEFLKGRDFQKLMSRYLGKPASLATLQKMQRDIIRFSQTKRNRLLVDVWFPEQKIENGVVQIVLIEGTVREITVVNDGKKYFSDKLIRSKFHIKEGEDINPTRLNQDLNVASQNSYFRDVTVALKVPDKEHLNTSDVELRVQDRFPLRAYLGYEDSGNIFIGEDRLLGGFNYGNVFGLDHQLNYQYMTDTDFKFLKAHSMSYVMPLRWHDTLTLTGDYAELVEDTKAFGAPALDVRGTYYDAGLRYRSELPGIDAFQHGVTAGFDFKHTDNNLAFGGARIFQSPIEVVQAVIGYDANLRDKYGRTAVDGQMFFSPGGITSDNSDENFNKSRVGAKADYFYARAQLIRETALPDNWNWVIHATGQMTGDRLVATEQLSAGGYATVRGYDERVANGDYGIIVNNEIYAPAMSFGLGRFFGFDEKPGLTLAGNGSDQLQFLGFLDYGYITQADFNHNVDTRRDFSLASVGAGVRFKFRTNLSVRFDYGFQIGDRVTDVNHAISDRSRVHIGVVASF